MTRYRCSILCGNEIIDTKYGSQPCVECVEIKEDQLDNKTIPDLPSKAFLKADQEKVMLSLVPAASVEAVARAMQYGLNKYPRDNWKRCDDPGRFYDAALRHQSAYAQGEAKDPESGIHHLAHAAASLLILLELERSK